MKTLLSSLILIVSITTLTACGPRTRVANNAMKNPGKEFSEDNPVDYDSLELPWERGKDETENRAGAGDADFDRETPDSGESESGNKLLGETPEAPAAETPTTDKPAAELKLKAAWDRKKNGAEFTRLTLDAINELGENLLNSKPSDIEKYCANYSSLQVEDKKAVWLMLISAMAYYESRFNPKAAYQESFKNSKADLVVSRGLLQLSSESARAYGCKIEKESDLEDPKTNLSCTVRILNKHVPSDGVVSKKVEDKWHGGARYWSVLRSQRSVPVIRKAVRTLPQCGQN